MHLWVQITAVDSYLIYESSKAYVRAAVLVHAAVLRRPAYHYFSTTPVLLYLGTV